MGVTVGPFFRYLSKMESFLLFLFVWWLCPILLDKGQTCTKYSQIHPNPINIVLPWLSTGLGIYTGPQTPGQWFLCHASKLTIGQVWLFCVFQFSKYVFFKWCLYVDFESDNYLSILLSIKVYLPIRQMRSICSSHKTKQLIGQY